METSTELTEKYHRLFRENITGIESVSAPFFNSFRGKAIEKFISTGLPSRKNEAYKYTDLNTYFRQDFESYFVPGQSDFEKASKFRCDVEELDVYTVMLLNGFYPENGNKFIQLPAGVWIGTLNEAATRFRQVVEYHFNRYVSNVNDGLIHLNTALASGGLFIYVPENVQTSKPVQIVNIIDSEKDIFNQRRNLIVVGANSSFTLIVCDHTLSLNKFLTNTVTEIYTGENASFNILRVQNEHDSSFKITNTFIYQDRNSVVTSGNITLHGGLVRNSTTHYLAGQGAECNSYGLYLTDKWQHADNYVNVEHLAPRCTSNQLYKGVLDDMSTGTFNGRIYVAQGAQGTSAYQKNNNILLAADAKMYTRPQLEIYADDVKCSHGATVGQLNEDEMFYLQSRGIDKNEARLMLMSAFAHEVIQNIPVKPLRNRMDELVIQRLRGELTRCTYCTIKCG